MPTLVLFVPCGKFEWQPSESRNIKSSVWEYIRAGGGTGTHRAHFGPPRQVMFSSYTLVKSFSFFLFCKVYVLSVTFYVLEVCKIWFSFSFSFILCFLTFFSFSIFLFLYKQAFSQVQSIISIYLRNFAKIVLIDDKLTTYCKVISAGEIFVSNCFTKLLQHSYASFFIKFFT